MIKKTERGFYDYGELTDERGVKAYVRESSLATARRVWLFVDESESIYTDKVNKNVALHLSNAGVKRLIKILEKSLSAHRLD